MVHGVNYTLPPWLPQIYFAPLWSYHLTLYPCDLTQQHFSPMSYKFDTLLPCGLTQTICLLCYKIWHFIFREENFSVSISITIRDEFLDRNNELAISNSISIWLTSYFKKSKLFRDRNFLSLNNKYDCFNWKQTQRRKWLHL